MVKKIYFIENSIQFNSLDLNTTKIAGSEKTLINISNELGKNNDKIKYVKGDKLTIESRKNLKAKQSNDQKFIMVTS